jgi:predicted RNA-binding Zn-ribbon protein involved in translation (DUF1610 family)
MNIALSYPALNGEVVTEAHAAYCRTNGHAKHTVDGIVQMHCPRCDEVIMVRIRVTTNPGQITGEPMPYSLAVKTLAYDYDIPVSVWYSSNSYTNDLGWTFTLLYV